MLEDLELDRGHEVVKTQKLFGAVQVIRVEAGKRPEGVSDPRRGGAALGEGRRR